MRKTMILGVTTVAGTVMAVAPASATSYEIDLTTNDFALASQSVAYWDQDNDSTTCAAVSGGYTPVYDGTFLGNSDAFDSGLVVTVGSTDFADPNDTATLQNNVLSTGAPATAAGLKVSSTARAIQSSPTLQYLVKFHNPTKDTIKRTVAVSSNLGSDTGTTILKDSSGDLVHGNADRWIVTGDAPAAPFSDPLVTQVLRGPNPPETTTLADAYSSGDDCMAEDYTVRVPGGQNRYLLLFAEMHLDKKSAVNDATVYNKQGTMSGVLNGISHKLYPQIVNWSLKK
jgi:hypothetical protein